MQLVICRRGPFLVTALQSKSHRLGANATETTNRDKINFNKGQILCFATSFGHLCSYFVFRCSCLRLFVVCDQLFVLRVNVFRVFVCSCFVFAFVVFPCRLSFSFVVFRLSCLHCSCFIFRVSCFIQFRFIFFSAFFFISFRWVVSCFIPESLVLLSFCCLFCFSFNFCLFYLRCGFTAVVVVFVVLYYLYVFVSIYFPGCTSLVAPDSHLCVSESNILIFAAPPGPALEMVSGLYMSNTWRLEPRHAANWCLAM